MEFPSPDKSSSQSSSDSSRHRRRGKPLRQEAVEQDHELRDKFNMALRINFLEEQLLLLKSGEGFTEADVLIELSELHAALNAREDELRQRSLEWIRVVDELKCQLEEAKAAVGQGKGPQHEKRSVSEDFYRQMCLRLQNELDGMTEQRHKDVDDTSALQQEIIRLTTDLEYQDKTMHELKCDHQKSLDSIYELEARIQQMEKQLKESNTVSLALEKQHKREIYLLNEDLKHSHLKCVKMREEFRQARDTAQALKNKEKTTQRIIFELKESNRILHEKLQECHKHYKRAVHENDNLLEAVRKYKDALAVRNVEVERYIKRLRVRCSVEVVGHVITKQLQETRDILSATYKRLNNVSICSGDRGTRQQADNYIHQIESVSERWGRVLAKFHELQQEILDKLSRGYNETENQQPSWVLDVKQQCSSLRVKARIVSRTFRDLMNILVRQMQLQENGKSGSTVGSKTEDDVSILNCVELIHGDHLAILDKRLEKLEHDILQHISSSKSAP